MKFNSLQATPRRRRQQREPLVHIPKTYGVNQLLINDKFQEYSQQNSQNNKYDQLRSSKLAENSVFSSTSYNNQSQYEHKLEPFYIDTIQKVKKVLSHKQNQEDEQRSQLSPQRIEEHNGYTQYNLKNNNANINSTKRRIQIPSDYEESNSFLSQTQIRSARSRQKDSYFQKQFEEPLTSRQRNITTFSQFEQHIRGSSTNRQKCNSFSKHIDSFSLLEKQMNIQPTNNFNQSKDLEQQNTQTKQNINEQLNSYRNTLALADKNINEQYYQPEIQNPSKTKRVSNSSSRKREKYHSNTFFRLEEEKALQFENSKDIIDMAEVAMKNLSHQQVLQKRKKLYEPDLLDEDEQKKIKCHFIQKTNLVQSLEESELNQHIKERINALQNIENSRYQRKYGLVEILKEADQIKNERLQVKQKVPMDNQPSSGPQEIPFRKNSYTKHSRELSEFHIDNIQNRLYEKNQQQQQQQQQQNSIKSKRKEQSTNTNNQKLQNKQDLNVNSADVRQPQNVREIKDYQKQNQDLNLRKYEKEEVILRDMKKQGEYYSKVSELLNTIYFSTPEDSFKEEELKLFRRHQQAIIEDIKSKKKK